MFTYNFIIDSVHNNSTHVLYSTGVVSFRKKTTIQVGTSLNWKEGCLDRGFLLSINQGSPPSAGPYTGNSHVQPSKFQPVRMCCIYKLFADDVIAVRVQSSMLLHMIIIIIT